jgi:putative ABC transport system permease protein
MRDLFAEIFAAMRYNKMRIGLTGFSVAWGIFLLIVMLGAGNGVLQGVINGLPYNAENIINVKTDTTTLAYRGLQKIRGIRFTDNDCRRIHMEYASLIDKMVPQLDTTVVISYAAEHAQTGMNGFYPDYLMVVRQKIIAGRDINQADIHEQRKVCVITQSLAKRLFHRSSPLGKRINIYDISVKVVGVTKPLISADRSKAVYMPFTTVRDLYFRDDHVSSLNMVMKGLDTEDANRQFVKDLRTMLATQKNVSVKDEKAIVITNDFEYYLQITGVLKAFQFFIWIVGLASLVAGVVGISNIMLITVRERMRELGVRKAMGASSFSIIRLVLLEALITTLIFGYVGMLLGIGLTQLADKLATSVLGPNNDIFCNPTVSFPMIMIANAVLLIAGLIAGYIPAKRAVSMKLVNALAGIG